METMGDLSIQSCIAFIGVLVGLGIVLFVMLKAVNDDWKSVDSNRDLDHDQRSDSDYDDWGK